MSHGTNKKVKLHAMPHEVLVAEDKSVHEVCLAHLVKEVYLQPNHPGSIQQ
jgi:hypothetical protein